MLGGGRATDGAEPSRGDRRNLSGELARQIFDGTGDLGVAPSRGTVTLWLLD